MRGHQAAFAIAALACVSAPTLASSDESRAVTAVVGQLLDSWRNANNAQGERVLHKDFRLTTFQGEGTDRKVHSVDRAGLLKASSDLKPGDWDDRLRDIQVRVGSNGLAIVTARYLFHAGGEPSHCGLVALQLYKEAVEWKIVSFADTHNNLNGRPEKEVCPA